jgi:hypothetical protein
MAKRAALAWLSKRTTEERRTADLSELVAMRYPLLRHRREFRRKLEEIEDQIAERLLPVCQREFPGLDDNERLAALDAVADALEAADLSDETVFRADADPLKLARDIRRQVPHQVRAAGLAEPAAELYGLVLDQSCYFLAHLIRELPEFQSRAVAETLSRLSRIAEQIGAVLERLPVTSLDRITDTDQDQEFLARYAELVSALYDRLEILGITTNYYEPSLTLTVAYLSLTASTSANRDKARLEPDQLRTDDYRQQVLRVEDALADKRRIIIQGDAGAGKSTLLQWLAITAVRQRFAGRLTGWNGLIPFLIRLRDFTDSRLPDGDTILLHANAPQWGIVPEGWVHRVATDGNALFLVDGVDELPEQDRSRVRDWLKGLHVRYPDCRIVVTSRPSDTTARWHVRDGFQLVTLEPMTAQDVHVFIDRWHTALLDSSNEVTLTLPCPRQDVPKHQRSLLAHLAARPHLRALARTPLLCAMICALNLDRRANLPRDRMTLYDAALDMLLERRDAEKQVLAGAEVQLNAVEKRALLRALAWWLNENRRAEMSREEAVYQLARKIDAMPGVSETPGVVLTHLLERSGLLRQPVIGRIDFVHRTFQEFLAAKEVVERDSIDLLINNAHSDLWRETVLMACAHATAPQRDRLLNGIVNRAYDFFRADEIGPRRHMMLLAAACVEISVEVSTDVIARVENCMGELVPPTSPDEVNTLATVGSVLFRVLPESLQDYDEQSAIYTVRTVALSNEPKALDVLALYAADERWTVQDELLNCARFFDLGEYSRRVLADALFFDHTLEITESAWLRHLPTFRGLTKVDIKIHAEKFDTLSAFAAIPALHSLLAELTGDCDLGLLGHHRQLRYLNLTCAGRFTGLATLRDLITLRELILTPGEPIENLAFLGALPGLTRLELAQLGTAADLRLLHSLTELSRLGLRGCQASVDLGALADNLPKLDRIDLRDCLPELDLTPLACRPLKLLLNRSQQVEGLDKLGESADVQLF